MQPCEVQGVQSGAIGLIQGTDRVGEVLRGVSEVTLMGLM